MKITAATLLSIACFLGIARCLQCARILAIIPTPSYSHQIPYRPLWLELVKRGHELVLVTANPIPNANFTTLTQINVGSSYSTIRAIDFINLRFEGKDWLAFLDEHMVSMSLDFAENVLNSTEMKKLYAPDSGVTFDLFITEMLLVPSMYVFAHRFNVPMIGVATLGTLTFNEYILGGIPLASHEYTWEMESKTGSNLPFWKRLRNFVLMWRLIYKVYHDLVPPHQALTEKYFGKDIPSVIEIQRNTSLLFVNQADALTPAKPQLPNLITFSSTHVNDNPKPLSEDLQNFLDDASEGFIYFSLGSNAMSSDLPKEVLQTFIDVFAKLPYKIVWKFEKEPKEKMPKNVYIAKWLPQQSILAHPKIKLFIYQGGLQSTEETVQFGVPVVGFPVLADQDYQVARMEALGVGKMLEIVTVTRDELESAIREVITNKTYKEKILALRSTINDNPHNVVENLAWWCEYVIRHKGAPHFRSTITKQPWYQRYDMDIVAFLAIVAYVTISTLISQIAKIVAQTNQKQRQTYHTNRKQKIS